MTHRFITLAAAIGLSVGVSAGTAFGTGPVLAVGLDDDARPGDQLGRIALKVLVGGIEALAIQVTLFDSNTVRIQEPQAATRGFGEVEGQGASLPLAGSTVEFVLPPPGLLPDGIYVEQVRIEASLRSGATIASNEYRYFDVKDGEVIRIDAQEYNSRTVIPDAQGRLPVAPGPSLSAPSSDVVLLESGDTGVLSYSERGVE